MPKEERVKMTLRLLADTGLALPPKVIYKNLKNKQSATFGERAVNNYLSEAFSDGLVDKPEWGEGYYEITERGRMYVEGELDPEDLRDGS